MIRMSGSCSKTNLSREMSAMTRMSGSCSKTNLSRD
jgi:hypothetical protein